MTKRKNPGDAIVDLEKQKNEDGYQAFLDRLRQADIDFEGGWYRNKHTPESISVSWTTGGVSGGSCWGTSADRAEPGEPEPEFEALDKILELICPGIGYLQYKGVYRDVVKTEQRRRNDYYGNYTDMAKKVVDLRSLFEALRECGLL